MSDYRRPTVGAERGGGAGGENGAGRGTGPGGDSPVECLLREAMAARAARITTQDLRPADPPKGPRMRRRPAYLMGLPLMGLAAATLIGVLTIPTDTLADRRGDAPAATMSASPDPSGGTDPLSPTAQPSDALGVPAGAPPGGSPQDSPDPAAGQGSAPGRGGTAGGGGGTGGGSARSPEQSDAAPGAPSGAAPAPGTAGTGVARPSQGIEVSFDGLAGAEAIAGGELVTFSVSWRNTTQESYEAVAPVVAVRALADPVGTDRTVRGRLQREDAGGTWTEVPLTEATGAYLTSGDPVAFALAPGAVQTVRYRLDPAIDSAEGTLLLQALAVLPTAKRAEEASTLTALRLSRAPASARKAPAINVEKTALGVVTMTVRNPGAAPLASVVPTVRLNGKDAAKIVVQARYGSGIEGLRTLPAALDGNGQLMVDTTLLERLVKPRESTAFTFQFSVPDDWRPEGMNDFAVLLGAKGDGQDAAPVVVYPGFNLLTAPLP
ncbi:hypothetical protein ACFVUH_07875 [Kitasatospora sp. NPDC058032]|uniref:hypothetical protein n=1 Tax=Kitasatospora sp. NPDC058032 TaxID=3346307 RepID=UPI0036D95607